MLSYKVGRQEMMLFKFSSPFDKLSKKTDFLSTTFQQKMWKTFLPIALSAFLIFSCATPSSKKIENPKEVKIGMDEREVREILGEPTVISKTPDGTIIWAYRPSWKIIPDNRGTLLIEFKNGKATKIIRVR